MLKRLRSRSKTVWALLAHFSKGQRAVLLPFVIVLLLSGLLLVATQGLSYVAPFVYTLF